MNIQFIKQILCDGHRFWLDRSENWYLFTKRYWRCDKCGATKTTTTKNE
jgi:hypothetical protein